jgi:Ala-tRNA(Pro) deacylase
MVGDGAHSRTSLVLLANMSSLAAEFVAAVGGGAVDAKWASLGASAEVTTLLQKQGPLLRAMLNMGVRQNTHQLAAYEAASKDATLTASIEAIAAGLGSQHFLAGASAGASDAHVAGALYDPLSLLFPPSLVSSGAAGTVAQWFARVTSLESIAAVIAAKGLRTGGVQRVGRQVDLRAVPSAVGALADASIARNDEYKKSQSKKHAEAPAPAPAPAAAASSSAAASTGPGAVAAAAVVAAASQPESNKELPNKSVDERIAIATAKLDALGISYKLIRHAAAGNVDELHAALDSAGCGASGRAKNLFVRAKKEKAAGDSRNWLVVALHDTKVDLVQLATKLGYGKIMIRFADADTLVTNLGVVQGHVSPLCLMNDAALQVNVALDARLAGCEELFFHPLTNEASVAISYADLQKFIAATGHKAEVVDFA